MVVFNYGLLFDESTAAQIVAASQEIAKIRPLKYALGENSHPHITILQIPAPREKAEALWNSVQGLIDAPIPVDLGSLVVDRWREWDAIWLRVRPNPQLQELQAKALEILGNYDYVNGTGDAFEPHITLAAWPIDSVVPQLPLPEELINLKSVETRLTFGVSAPNFQYESLLFEAPFRK